LYKLGLTYYAHQKYKKCIKTLKAALKNQPLVSIEPDIYYHIGLAYCRVQKFEKSIWPYSRCVERAPSDIRFVHERAKAYQMIELHKEAVDDFTAVIERNKKNAHAHFRRAFSLKALKVSFFVMTLFCRIIAKQLRTSRGPRNSHPWILKW
jgi:tetratricopeptide (TPR) repeat protein